MTMRSWLFAALISTGLLLTSARGHAQAGASEPRKLAVLVGANEAAPGRKPLRFSHADAQAFGRVLVELGGFAPKDVLVLLDPDPDAVLRALDGQLAQLHQGQGDALLFFYYSGHADAGSLYPRGRPLALTALRERLSDPRASVRIGLIDACRGGGWTGTKGLDETEPFEVSPPFALDNQGSVLISSSSGLEDAHESEQLGGSFFTHYWNAALRGAADSNADARVTVAEAFEYAKSFTIRDTALYTHDAQHPSFAMNLRGRQDLALTTVSLASASLNVSQQKGPLELVHLGSGVVVMEIPKGARTLKLAVAPGHYLLRRREGAQVWAEELNIGAGQVTRVDEGNLELVGHSAMVIKRAEPRPLTLTTLPRGGHELTFDLGVSHIDSAAGAKVHGGRSFEFGVIMPWGITDRLQWVIPSLALTYRGGNHGGFEWLPWGGLTSWGFGYSSLSGVLLDGRAGAGIDLRRWLGERSSIDLGLSGSSHWRFHSGDALPHDPRWQKPTTWRSTLSLGYTLTVADTVTFHIAAAFNQNQLYEGNTPQFSAHSKKSNMTLSFGSVQAMGLRPLPLVRVHLSDHCALNIDASVQYNLATKSTVESYTAGASFYW
jgi:hypothetical protein